MSADNEPWHWGPHLTKHVGAKDECIGPDCGPCSHDGSAPVWKFNGGNPWWICGDCRVKLADVQTIDAIRVCALRLITWCDDYRAEPQIVGSIMAELNHVVGSLSQNVERNYCQLPACGCDGERHAM